MPRPSPATARFHADIILLEKLAMQPDRVLARMPLPTVIATLTFPARRPQYRLRQALLWIRLAPCLADFMLEEHQRAAERLFRFQHCSKPAVAFKAVTSVLRLALPPAVSTAPKPRRPKRPNNRWRKHLRTPPQRFQKPLKPATTDAHRPRATAAHLRVANPPPPPYDLDAVPRVPAFALASPHGRTPGSSAARHPMGGCRNPGAAL